jgi:hypothetical protein
MVCLRMCKRWERGREINIDTDGRRIRRQKSPGGIKIHDISFEQTDLITCKISYSMRKYLLDTSFNSV